MKDQREYPTVKVYPSIGDVFYVEINIPNYTDEDKFVDEWLDEHIKNVEFWEWAI